MRPPARLNLDPAHLSGAVPPAEALSLYQTVKRFVIAAGCRDKGGINGWDAVAELGDDPKPLTVVAMRLGFSHLLLPQAVDRLCATDIVWIAAIA